MNMNTENTATVKKLSNEFLSVDTHKLKNGLSNLGKYISIEEIGMQSGDIRQYVSMTDNISKYKIMERRNVREEDSS